MRRVNWILFGERAQAASRFQGYLVHDYLRSRGLDSRLLAAPPIPHHDVPWQPETHNRIAQLVHGEIVVFQKIWGPLAESLRDVFSRETTVLYAEADYSPENPLPLRCDGVICSSKGVAQWHESQGMKTWVLRDPAELWLEPRRASEPGRVQICWIAHRKNLETLEPLRELLGRPEFAEYDLVTVSNHPTADVQWSEEAARRVLQSSHVGAVPVRRTPEAARASSNRAVSLMAAGLPVVADRLPSYEEVIENGRTGYLCDSMDDWRVALQELLDPARRAQIGAAGQASIDPEYRMETIGEQWLNIFRSFGLAGTPARRPRLLAYARVHEKAGFARTAVLKRTALPRPQGMIPQWQAYSLPLVLGQAAQALVWSPAAPGGFRTIVELTRDLARPVAGRTRDAVRNRLLRR